MVEVEQTLTLNFAARGLRPNRREDFEQKLTKVTKGRELQTSRMSSDLTGQLGVNAHFRIPLLPSLTSVQMSLCFPIVASLLVSGRRSRPWLR